MLLLVALGSNLNKPTRFLKQKYHSAIRLVAFASIHLNAEWSIEAWEI